MPKYNEVRYRKAERQIWAHAGVTPAERNVRLPAAGIEVRVQQVGDGPPILFIHGGPNAGSTWAPLVAHLHDVQCLIIDRPGTGLSDPWPAPIDANTLAPFGDSFVADVLDGLGIQRAHLVGSSFGGYIALRSAARHPTRVDRMVQMACPAFASGMAVPTFMRLLTVPGMVRLMDLLPANERASRSILRQIGHGASLDEERIPQAFFDWYVALQRHTPTMHNDSAMIARLVRSWRAEPAHLALKEDVLANVAAPTYFLWGADDAFGGADVAQRMVALMPNAQLEMVPRCGHLPWLDQPQHAAEVVAAHLVG